EIRPFTHRQPEEARLGHAHNRERSAVDVYGASNGFSIAVVPPLPIPVADHGYRVAIEDAIVVGREQAARDRADAQRGEILTRDELPVRGMSHAARGRYIERLGNSGGQ